jgi:hypothetical protein
MPSGSDIHPGAPAQGGCRSGRHDYHPNNDRRNEQVTDVHQACLECMGGEGWLADGEVSRRRGFHPDVGARVEWKSGSSEPRARSRMICPLGPAELKLASFNPNLTRP